jgi:type VI secretion system protein ImpH
MSGLESEVNEFDLAGDLADDFAGNFETVGSDKNNPLRRGFYSSLTLLESQNPSLPRLGEALRPQHEPVRVGQWPFMNFAVRELAQVENSGDLPRIYFQNFGLLGPQGALPLHLTEYALNRIQHSKDHTFTEFLNVFHHRMYLLFYRAWANAQPHIGWRESDLNPYSRSAANLAGHGAEVFAGQMEMLDSRRIGGAAHLTRLSRSREGLERWLAGVTGLEVKALDFVGRWFGLSAGDSWRLGEGQQQLGASTLLGRRCLDVQSTVQIEYGPMGFARYLELMPGKRQRLMLDEAVACHLGLEFEWNHCLLLKAEEVPPCRLTKPCQQTKQGAALGRTAWLGNWANKWANKWANQSPNKSFITSPDELPNKPQPARVKLKGCQPKNMNKLANK